MGTRMLCEDATALTTLLLTLTYGHVFDKYHYYNHVQKFLQSVRDFMRRNLETQNKLRYACVGEHGGGFQQQHWHLILWNYPYEMNPTAKNQYDITKVEKDLEQIWKKQRPQNGFVQAEIPRNNNHIITYMVKDMMKGVLLDQKVKNETGYSIHPRKKSFMFRSSSKLGYEYAEKYKSWCQQSPIERNFIPSPDKSQGLKKLRIPKLYKEKWFDENQKETIREHYQQKQIQRWESEGYQTQKEISISESEKLEKRLAYKERKRKFHNPKKVDHENYLKSMHERGFKNLTEVKKANQGL